MMLLVCPDPNCGAMICAGKFRSTSGTVLPAHLGWVVRSIFTSFSHSAYILVTFTDLHIVVVGRISTYSFCTRLPTHVVGPIIIQQWKIAPKSWNSCIAMAEKARQCSVLFSHLASPTTVIFLLRAMTPCIVALFVLVPVDRRLQKPDQVIEHPDYQCVSETVSLDHRCVARFWAQEEYVIPGEIGLNFLQSEGILGSAGPVSLAKLVH
jgi:hypothetical protein